MTLHVWRTTSLTELVSWADKHHYRVEIENRSPAYHGLDYRTRIVTDGLFTVSRTMVQGDLFMRRSWNHVRQSNQSNYTFYYPITQPFTFQHCGQNEIVGPGESIVISGETPLLMSNFGDPDASYDTLFFTVPGHIVRSMLPMIDRLIGRRIAASNGQIRLARDFLMGIANCDNSVSDGMISKVLNCAIEVVSETFRNAEQDDHPVGSSDIHLERIKQCVNRNLPNKDISVKSVAEECGISERYLHLIMARGGKSFSKYLWSARLDQADQWLRSDGTAHLNIEKIAECAGFKNVSHFSRLYKATYGVSPKVARRPGGIA